MLNCPAPSTVNNPLIVVVLPEAPIFTGPPPNVNKPVVVANTFTGVAAVALVISPPLTSKSPVIVVLPPTVKLLLNTANPDILKPICVLFTGLIVKFDKTKSLIRGIFKYGKYYIRISILRINIIRINIIRINIIKINIIFIFIFNIENKIK